MDDKEQDSYPLTQGTHTLRRLPQIDDFEDQQPRRSIRSNSSKKKQKKKKKKKRQDDQESLRIMNSTGPSIASLSVEQLAQLEQQEKEAKEQEQPNEHDAHSRDDSFLNSVRHIDQDELHDMEARLDDLRFISLDQQIPWTHSMRMEATGSDEENFSDPAASHQLPLTHSELYVVRTLIRRHRNNQPLIDESEDDDEHLIIQANPELAHDKTARGDALRKIKGMELSPTGQLSEDTFSFLISAPIYSVPFVTGFIVLALKTTIFVLIGSNLIDLSNEDNPLGIPASVSVPVFLGQFFALFIAVASQDDIVTALNYFYEGYSPKTMGRAFSGASCWKWSIAVFTQFLEGCLGLETTFLLIITSENVVSLLLDFTAVEFVTLLDNAAFSLANQGFLGAKNKLESELILHTEYSVPPKRKRKTCIQLLTLNATFFLIAAFWVYIYYQQLQGFYTPKTLYVQFDDNLRSDLGAYSGFFDLKIRPLRIGIERIRYIASNREEGFFGYCHGSKRWTFSSEGRDPCRNVVVQSVETDSFDIVSVAEETWTVTEDSDSSRFFPLDDFQLDLGCDKDRDCGGRQGECNDNRCFCNEGFYGTRCDFELSSTCETIEVDTRRAPFSNSRTYSTTYSLLRNGDIIVQAYNHPVYYSQAPDGLDLVFFIGYRWVLTNSKDAFASDALTDHSPQSVAGLFAQRPFHAAFDLKGLEFFSEPVAFNTPDDMPSPTSFRWFTARNDVLENTANTGVIDSLFLCAVCGDDNPCQNGNQCNTEDGTCSCLNGAEGRLCQITPLENGRCDVAFNTASFSFDGGDCCQATCLSSSENECGIVSSDGIEGIDRGYPFCRDPSIITTCSGSNCWSPNSRNIDFLSPENPALVTLSANGRIMVVAEPALDALRVFDQTDSRWVQRGPIIEGSRGTAFGRTLVMNTLPGAVVGRRFGRVPVLLAIGSHGVGTANVRVMRWEPNDIDWRPVGDEIPICEEIPDACDLVALDIARDANRLTLSVVRADNLALIYRTTLTPTGSQPWVLQYFSNGTLANGGSFTSTSLAATGNMVFFPIGLRLEFFSLTDEANFRNRGNILANAQSLRTARPRRLPFTGDDPHIGDEFNALRQTLGWRVVPGEDAFIHSVKVSSDSRSFLILMTGTLGFDFFARFDITSDSEIVISNFRNYTTARLSQSQLDAGLSIIRYSFDASSFAIRLNDRGTNSIEVVEYNPDDLLIRRVGTRFQDEELDFGISFDASVFVQGNNGATESYGIIPRCLPDEDHHRLAITLDEFPESLNWVVETYQTIGTMAFPNEVQRECAGCYFDNDRFGRAAIAEDVCVKKNLQMCTRLRFHAMQGLRPGAGLVYHLNGQEIFNYEGESTLEYTRNIGNGDCIAEELLVCSSDESHLMVEIRFDFFAEQISWTMTDGGGNVVGLGAGYSNDDDSGATRVFQMCAPRNDNYTFRIDNESETGRDPDGLCCRQGNGGYNLYLDGEMVYSRQGERQFRYDRVVFNERGTVEEHIPVTIELQLDENPDETAWLLEDTQFTILAIQRQYDGLFGQRVARTVYLQPGLSYVLALRDRFGDGFCCGATGRGWYRIYYGDTPDISKLLAFGPGIFTEWLEVRFSLTEESIISVETESFLTNETSSGTIMAAENTTRWTFLDRPINRGARGNRS